MKSKMNCSVRWWKKSNASSASSSPTSPWSAKSVTNFFASTASSNWAKDRVALRILRAPRRSTSQILARRSTTRWCQLAGMVGRTRSRLVCEVAPVVNSQVWLQTSMCVAQTVRAEVTSSNQSTRFSKTVSISANFPINVHPLTVKAKSSGRP